MSIKPPTGQSPIIPNQATETPNPDKNIKAEASPSTVNPEAVAKALKDFNKLKKKLKKPFISGAAGLFTDNVMFPADLLDPHNPANDPKYLHLLSAMLGIKVLEEYFSSEEQISDVWEDDEDDDKASDDGSER